MKSHYQHLTYRNLESSQPKQIIPNRIIPSHRTTPRKIPNHPLPLSTYDTINWIEEKKKKTN